MKTSLKIIFIIIFLSFASLHVLPAQKITQIRIPELNRLLGKPDNKLYVINFWATWCPPCVKELPGFMKVSDELRSENIEFIFISLDFPSQIESHLKPFLIKNKIKSDVLVMMDTDYDKWLGIVDQAWQGNIPATLFMNNHRKIKKFHIGELEEKEIRTLINSLL